MKTPVDRNDGDDDSPATALDSVDLDPEVLAFLKLKEEELDSGRARLSEPISPDEIRARMISSTD